MSQRVHRIFYDDACAFCTWQMRRLHRLDWRGRFRFVPRSAAEAREAGLSPAALETAIHCVTADGRVLRGAECLRFVGCRLPLLAPLAALLWLPGALPLAERVYAGISRRRYRWGRGAGATAVCETGTACPPRQEG